MGRHEKTGKGKKGNGEHKSGVASTDPAKCAHPNETKKWDQDRSGWQHHCPNCETDWYVKG